MCAAGPVRSPGRLRGVALSMGLLAAVPAAKGLIVEGRLGASGPALLPFRDTDSSSSSGSGGSTPPFVPAYGRLLVSQMLHPCCAVGIAGAWSAAIGRAKLAGASLQWLTVEAVFSNTYSLPHATFVTVELGLGHSWATYRVDDRLALDVRSLSGSSSLVAGWRLSDHHAISAGPRVEWVAPPYDKADWFNRPLHDTLLASISLGWSWRP